jgi:FtsP/CotA-like multicopper oxidase with cupredoxin domain
LIGVIPWVGGLINGKTLNTSDPAVVRVESRKTYRFRIISPSAFYPLEFSIDGHQFDVISADGSNVVKSGPYDYLNIHGGERYDILFNATAASGSRFWMRARTQEKSKPWDQVLAILSYGDNATTPLPSQDLYKGNITGTRYVNCFHDINKDCVPADSLLALPSDAQSVPSPDVTANLHLKFIHGPLISGVRFAEPETPPIFSNGSATALPGVWPCPLNITYDGCASQFGCNCTQVIDLKYNQQVRLVIDNAWPTTKTGVTGVHPFHLHGHKFSVLGLGYNSNYTDQLLNTVNPSLRDNIIIPAGGWAVLQFLANNSGSWMGGFSALLDRNMVDHLTCSLPSVARIATQSYHASISTLPHASPRK